MKSTSWWFLVLVLLLVNNKNNINSADGFVVVKTTQYSLALFACDSTARSPNKYSFFEKSKILPPVRSTRPSSQLQLSFDKNDANHTPPPPPLLELLAVAVSLFFVATVALTGDRLFVQVSPSNNTAEGGRVIIIDADALLKQEFDRIPSSVEFK